MMQRARARRSTPLILLLAGIMIAPAFFPYVSLADTDLNVGGVAVVAYANGDSVRLRSSPGLDGGVIDHIAEGTSVEVLDGPVSAGDGSWWYRVRTGGSTGYMISDYLASSPGLLTSTSGRAWTIDAVNVRGGPSTADRVITTLGNGAAVTLTGGYSNGWLSVSADGVDGWIYGAFVTQDSGFSSRSSQVASGATGTYYTADVLNLRSGPGLDRSILTELPTGTPVWLYGEESSGFARASTDYGEGWVYTAYLSASPTSSSSADRAQPVVVTDGQRMVDFAMQFLGYPYVWAGSGPGGFDCSGLTQYVVRNVLGTDITHSTVLQFGYGSAVGWEEWRAGDLVFFANTYTAGISHVGIYISEGNFIHAENPGTGVVISSLYSSYYSNHYAGARRLA